MFALRVNPACVDPDIDEKYCVCAPQKVVFPINANAVMRMRYECVILSFDQSL